MQMRGLVSPFLIGIGQTAAMLCYLLHDDRDAFREKPVRGLYTVLFYLLLSLTQARLHAYITLSGIGSLPTLPFLALSWLLYALFLLLWSRASWEICCFLAFVLLLADNCIWPLVSSISRMLWGMNYLYEGRIAIRIPFILTLSLLECALVVLIRRFMPEIRKIRLSVYDVILAIAIVVPFLYIRIIAGQSLSQDNKLTQIVMTACCLVAVITLAAEIGHSSSEYEKRREEQMKNVLHQQQAMFEQKLQDADELNRKYHDMKNFLLYLQANEAGGRELESSVNELMKSINPFGNSISSGNAVVDVILGGKAFCLRERGNHLCSISGWKPPEFRKAAGSVHTDRQRHGQCHRELPPNSGNRAATHSPAHFGTWEHGSPVSAKYVPRSAGPAGRNADDHERGCQKPWLRTPKHALSG